MRCGAEVVIAARRADVLESAADRLGRGCSWVDGDIREAVDCARIVDAAPRARGAFDTLLNNAGGQYFAAAEAITAKGWVAVQRLIVNGTLRPLGRLGEPREFGWLAAHVASPLGAR